MPSTLSMQHTTATLCLLFSFNLLAATSSTNTAPAPQTPGPHPPKLFPGDTQADRIGKAISQLLAENGTEDGDYVPCVFSQRDLLSLRLRPVSPTLTSHDADSIKLTMEQIATDPSNASAFPYGAAAIFINKLKLEPLEGKKPSEAFATVMDKYVNSLTQAKNLNPLSILASEPDKPLNQSITTQVKNLLSNSIASSNADQTLLSEFSDQFDKKITPALKEQKQPDLLPAYVLQQTYFVVSSLISDIKNSGANPESNFKNLSKTEKTNDLNALDTLLGQINATQFAMQSGNSISPIQSVLDTARGTINSFKRPSDVGCAMSILTWNEARYAFGPLIANEYIGIQVIVRNLNEKQEFLMHDVEVAVDADPDGRHARFYSGRDKLIVRSLGSAQQDFSGRNLIVHGLQAAGTLMSAVVPIAGAMFSDASSVYNAGFLPGFSRVWAGHDTENNNLLNDLGFSASSNSRTVVPKSGSVMFVIFVPSKQFEEGWWNLPCVDNILLGKTTSGHSTFPQTVTPDSTDSVGVDPDQLLAKCKQENIAAVQQAQATTPAANATTVTTTSQTATTSITSITTTVSTATEDQTATDATIPSNTSSTDNSQVNIKGENPTAAETLYFVKAPRIKYKKWSGNAAAIFRELTFTVVAGIHISDENANLPTVSQIDCPNKDTKGNITLNSSSDSISCTVTGANLDKATTIRLRNSQSPTDTKTVDGTISTSGDSSNGKVVFSVPSLGALNAQAYKAYAITNDSKEISTGAYLYFNLQPFLYGKLAPAQVPSSSDPKSSQPITFTGFHFTDSKGTSNIKGIAFSDGTTTVMVTYDAGLTETSGTVTLNASQPNVLKMLKNTTKDNVIWKTALIVTQPTPDTVPAPGITLTITPATAPATATATATK